MEPHSALDAAIDQLLLECAAATLDEQHEMVRPDQEEFSGDAAATTGLRVVDLGGGTGGEAARLALAGHRVTVVDPSPNSLAAVSRRAGELGLTNLDAVQGDEESLPTLFAAGSVDLVLCHGVLEFVDEPLVALESAQQVLRTGGRLSLLVAQRHGAMLRRVVKGHLRQAHQIATSAHGRTQDEETLRRRFTCDEVLDLLSRANFVPVDLRGIGLLADLIPPHAESDDALAAELDRYAVGQDTLLDLAANLHVHAVRPADRAGEEWP